MPSILDNLEKMRQAVEADKANGSPKGVGQKLTDHAVRAIMVGIDSKAWTEYMSLFADNAEQLKLLTEEDKVNDKSYYPVARAYIVANAVCGANTTGQTAQGVDTGFGATLSKESDGTVKKPFEF